MKIAVLDVTGRNAVQYNPSLCKALANNDESNNVVLLSPKIGCAPQGYKFKKLVRLIPEKWELSTSRIKRLLRALEVIINYLYVEFFIMLTRPDIIHIQWLPFLEFSSLESFILPLFRLFNRDLRIVLTVHNIYPHNMSKEGRVLYRKRFVDISKNINVFIVHLKSAKKTFVDEFKIPESRVFVSYHGIYEGKVSGNNDECKHHGPKKVLLYGYQSFYKGADIVVNAYNQLPKYEQQKLSITIVGKTDEKLYELCGNNAKKNGINWINRFVSDEELYSFISSSDLILLPYREISQSGVLLLALSYKKPILTSDLPSFIETLDGFPLEYFFKSGDINSLAHLLSIYAHGGIDEKQQIKIIQNLNEKYSWTETAKSTMKAYLYARQ